MPEKQYEMSAFVFGKLKESIQTVGQLVPIDKDEHGNIIDGIYRQRACDELGIECRSRVISGLTDEEKRDYRFTSAFVRRQASAEQQHIAWIERERELEDRVRSDPTRSDRSIGREMGVDHKTVAKARTRLEQAGDIIALDRVGRGAPQERAPDLEVMPDADRVAKRKEVSCSVIFYFPDIGKIRGRGRIPGTREFEMKEWASNRIPLTVPVLETDAQWAQAVKEMAEQCFKRGLERPPISMVRRMMNTAI